MKYILTPEQNAEIRDYLDKTDGVINKEFEFGDLTVVVDGYIETRGYYEDDYFNGTGAWVETYRNENINITAYDEDGEVNIVSDVA